MAKKWREELENGGRNAWRRNAGENGGKNVYHQPATSEQHAMHAALHFLLVAGRHQYPTPSISTNRMNTKHLLPCIIDPIPSCAVWGGIFTGIDAMQGAPLSIRTWGFYASGLWLYHASICPMEAIHGRRSALQYVTLCCDICFICFLVFH